MFKSKKKNNDTYSEQVSEKKLQHIAFIMDGNGRWAKKRLLPRSLGHKAGVERVKEIFNACFFEYKIPHMSLFVFSKENWKRSEKEINFLFKLLNQFFENNIDEMIKDDVKINIVGDLNDDRIPKDILNTIHKAHERTKDCKSGTFNILFNYGGQQDVVNATVKICEKVCKGELKISDIDIDMYKNYLWTKDIPYVDFLVRTSGEMRISNCYLYQLAYSELYFPKVHWPSFTKDDLKIAIDEFYSRNRRYGGIKKEDE